MSRYRARFWLNTLLVVLLIVAGGAIGTWISHLVAVSRDRGEMATYTTQVLDRAVTVFREADVLLAAVNNSPFEFCSDEEIRYLRNILFETKYLKDIGRVRDGAFHCSAVFGKAKSLKSLPPTDLRTADGKRVYPRMDLAISMSTAPVIESGSGNVVLDPAAVDGFDDPAFRAAVLYHTAGDKKAIKLFGGHDLPATIDLPIAGPGRKGDILYRNMCSEQACVAVEADVAKLQAAARPVTIVIIILCGLLGGALGLIYFLYRKTRSGMRSRLSRAIARNSLTVEYQPIVEIATGRMTGAEALVRWRENGEDISPEVFVPVAEKAGLINQLTLAVVDQVLASLGRHIGAHPDFRISINIAADDLFNRDFNVLLTDRLRKAGVDPRQIALEITERSTADSSAARGAIEQLKSRGHKILLDDFGTGYSSLGYLGMLNVDGIKIDKSFTQTIGTSSVTRSIVPQIVDMAKVHGLSIIVEGVETAAQRQYFAPMVPTVQGQGWLFGHPVTAAELIAMLDQRSPGRQETP
ncbi:EAL domain-containing protein [Phyllobacterium sp. 0TCS1.6C]|uniref:EAL domain-containing protein n=1 Tax=unclassified Phyllobacterium TaxID=2638441 RepID=UPI002264E599|nr:MULTISPECIES: EAL domain-containing protein [unclassified Phyllobacterium]MCX8280015.1 EAL domain-containing protein [Phyllobacterium sp. 0TCS1.6C]MCX8296182.1 EAL domain-containing protein [Phyllobacterium sp. 0TCS1.6A]